MEAEGVGWIFLVLASASLVACGATSEHGARDGAGGNAGASGAPDGAGASSTSKGGVTIGGGESAGTGGQASAGSTGTPPDALAEADPNEPCVEDPLAAHWTKSALDLSGGSNQVVKLGAGGPLAVLVGLGKDTLVARTNRADDGWKDAVAIPGSLGTDYPERVEVSPDGSTALVLWRRDQRMFFSLLNGDGSFAPAVELEVPQNVTPIALSEQRVLFGYGSKQGVQLLEYTPAAGLVPVAPLPTNFAGMWRGEGDEVAVFASSSLVAEPDELYPYELGLGFGVAQAISAHAMTPSAWQSSFFAFPNGRAARVTRTWEDPATRGMYLTTRQADSWGDEQRVSPFDGMLTDPPMLGYTQDRLLLAWLDEDRQVVAVREHDGNSWQAERVLPRSRGLQQTSLSSAEGMVVLIGEQRLPSEQVSVKKLYRRGSDGTWYCPKLLPDALSQLAGDGQGFWLAQRGDVDVQVWRFKP